MANVKELYNRIEKYYNKIFEVRTTQSRRYNYRRICDLLEEYPIMQEYWQINPEARYYKDSVTPLRSEPLLDVTSSPATNDIHRITKIEAGVLSPVLLSNTPNDCGAYIIFLKEHDMIKVGKAKNFYARVNQLRSQYGEILPIHLFTFDNEEDAYMMEIVLHKYYKEKYPNSQFIPQDRFAEAGCSLADIEILSQAARKIKQTKWF